ncbi:hypothetical protein, partial [Shewanella schlegeliana]
MQLKLEGAKEHKGFQLQNPILIYDINGSGLADDIDEFSIAKLSSRVGGSDFDGLLTLDTN